MKKIALCLAGFLFLGMGLVGVVLPIWPTTPFVLLAAGCFANTPRMRGWILGISFFREHLENYQQRKGLSQRTLTISLCWLWGLLLLSAVLTQLVWLRLLLLAIGAAVTAHLVYMARKHK